MKIPDNVSKEHAAYLVRERRKTIIINLSRASLFILLIALWEGAARLNLIDAFITSSPSRVVATTIGLAKNDLFLHVGITLLETIIGFIASTVIGTIIATLLWWSAFWKSVFEPFFVVMNSLPKIALGPIIIIWCGAGMKAIIMMTILICVVITILSVLEAFTSADSEKILLLRSMNAKKHEIFLKLVFPSALPVIISTLKINVGLAFVGSIMGEYLVSRAGLGYLIVYGGQVFKLDLVMASTVILLFLAGLIYFLVSLLERLVIRYR